MLKTFDTCNQGFKDVYVIFLNMSCICDHFYFSLRIIELSYPSFSVRLSVCLSVSTETMIQLYVSKMYPKDTEDS